MYSSTNSSASSGRCVARTSLITTSAGDGTIRSKVSPSERLPSETVTVTLVVPTSPIAGVPEIVAVPSPLSVNVTQGGMPASLKPRAWAGRSGSVALTVFEKATPTSAVWSPMAASTGG